MRTHQHIFFGSLNNTSEYGCSFQKHWYTSKVNYIEFSDTIFILRKTSINPENTPLMTKGLLWIHTSTNEFGTEFGVIFIYIS